ncbi:MAG: hypothetical protein ACOC1O_06435 [bacterium]
MDNTSEKILHKLNNIQKDLNSVKNQQEKILKFYGRLDIKLII